MAVTGSSRHTEALAIVSLAIVLTLAVVACAGGSPAPTPSPTVAATPTANATASPSLAASLPAGGSPAITGAQVCADLAALQADLDVLTGLDLESAGVRDVLGAIQATITSGQAFIESSRTVFGPEAQALGTSLTDLQEALQGITGEGTLGDKAATIENAVDEVAAAFDALKAKVSPGCPAPEASGS